ncbi:MAG: hypothetical protein RL689_1162 [Planctomycetota bacterium]|jgi:hypothetical protein
MGTLFGTDDEQRREQERDEALIRAYEAQGRTLDALPYTDEFDRLYVAAGGDAAWGGPGAAFRRLHNLRKAGKLPRLGRAGIRPIRVSSREEEILGELVTVAVGSLGQRDQLPFDPRFDQVHAAFRRRSGRDLSRHDFWRLVAKIAK